MGGGNINKIDVLTEHQAVKGYVARVRELADENRDALGFLPTSAYEDLAARDKLWVAVDSESNELLAYLLFGGRYPHLKIVQLYVSPRVRGSGIGSLMISALKAHAQRTGLQTISARVAADLKANEFWERCGLRLVRQVRGGATTGRFINIRLFDVPQTSLWESDSASAADTLTFFGRSPILESPNYVIDVNVFFDVIRNRPETETAKQLVSSALANVVKLSVTREFSIELRRHSYAPDADPVLKLADSLPCLPSPPDRELTSLVQQIRAVVVVGHPKSGARAVNESSDLIHLASCIYHRVGGFLTRDSQILKKATELRAQFGLNVLAPAELMADLHAGDVESDHLLAAVQGQEFSVERLSEDARPEAEAFLKALGTPADIAAIALSPGTTHRQRIRTALRNNGQLIGLVSYEKMGAHKEVVGYFFLNEDHPLALRVVDHVLEALVGAVPIRELWIVKVTCPAYQERTRDTAVKRKYQVEESLSAPGYVQLTRLLYRGAISKEIWPYFIGQIEARTSVKIASRFPPYEELCNTGVICNVPGKPLHAVKLFDLETALAPLKILGDGRPGVLVPIRERYAIDLLTGARKQFSLLPTKESALYVERAYFMKAKLKKLFPVGALVVFYISGAGNGRKEAVGVARITFYDTLTVTQTLASLSRQGVLEEREVREAADERGKLNVFTFDSYIPFISSVSYDDLKSMDCVGKANLITAQALTMQQIEKIMRRGLGQES